MIEIPGFLKWYQPSRVLWVVIVVCQCYSMQCYAGEPLADSQTELLQKIADGIEANHRAIRTWTGSLARNVTTLAGSKVEGKPLVLRRSTDFFVDRSRDAVRLSTEYLGPHAIHHDGNELLKGYRGELIRNMMWKDGGFYEVAVVPKEGRVELEFGDFTVRRLSISERDSELATKAASVQFSPMDIFSRPYEEIPEALRYWASLDENRMDLRVRQVGSRVIISNQLGDNVNTYEFDLKIGGNLVSFFADNGEVKERQVFEYDLISDIWVPKSWAKNVHRLGENGSFYTSYSSKVGVSTEMVNLPIDEAEFTVEAMGIQKGDIVVDYRAGKIKYVFGEELEQALGQDSVMSDEFLVPLKVESGGGKNAAKDIDNRLSSDIKAGSDEAQTVKYGPLLWVGIVMFMATCIVAWRKRIQAGK